MEKTKILIEQDEYNEILKYKFLFEQDKNTIEHYDLLGRTRIKVINDNELIGRLKAKIRDLEHSLQIETLQSRMKEIEDELKGYESVGFFKRLFFKNK